MVSSVQNSSTELYSTQTQENNSLSASQKEEIASILENYDASSLSQEDAKEIVAAFEDLGISPSRDLANTMREEGFSAREVGSLSMKEDASSTQAMNSMPPPPPPSDSSSSDTEEEDALALLLEELLAKEIEEQEEEEQKELVNPSGSKDFQNEILDMASKINNLNDKSKQNVMDLMDKYSKNDDALSQEDISSVVSNSLSQILNNASNYKQNSFYA